MPTQTINLGVAVEQFIIKRNDQQVDFTIQNLSANNIEVGDTATLNIGTGLRIVPNGNLTIEKWRNDLYLISSGANSDVRIMFQEYPIPIAECGVPQDNTEFPRNPAGGG